MRRTTVIKALVATLILPVSYLAAGFSNAAPLTRPALTAPHIRPTAVVVLPPATPEVEPLPAETPISPAIDAVAADPYRVKST